MRVRIIVGRNLRDGARAYRSGDRTRAERIFTRIARHGSAAACWNLYVLNCDAGGTDWTRTLGWLRSAAERGHPDAQFELAVRLALGDGLQANPGEAIPLFEAAWAGGIDEASFNLALLHAGLGLSYSWMHVAAQLAVPGAEQLRQQWAGRLKEEEIRQAVERGNEFLAHRRPRPSLPVGRLLEPRRALGPPASVAA